MTAKSNAREGDGVADALVELALREGVRVLYTLTDAEADKWREYCDSVDADDLPELMRAAIAAMQAQQGAEPVAWIPVGERLPPVETVVLAWDTILGDVVRKAFRHNGRTLPSEYTHWQPLPTAPATGAPR